MRGNGTLLFTEDSLAFEMWIPRKELIIPFSAIKGIENPRTFLGKSNFTPLLKIDFTNESGEADAAAWLVRDVDSVQDTLEELL